MGAAASGLDNIGECCQERGYEKPGFQGFEDDPRLEDTIMAVSQNLFKQFDMDCTQSLDNKQELQAMLQELRLQGYIFTGDDRTVISQMLAAFDRTGQGRIYLQDFADWFKLEVVARGENLRTLLYASPWVNAVIVRMHREADEDSSGTVSQRELRRALRKIYSGLGEPPPTNDEIVETVKSMMKCDDEKDGELNLREFKQALIELMVKLYFTHFNESMNNPHSKRNLQAARTSELKQRDLSYHPQAASSVSGHIMSLPEKVAEQRRLREAEKLKQLGDTSYRSSNASTKAS